MRQQTADFAVQHADELPASGNLDAEQLFRREAERMLLVHRRHIVEPVEIRNRLHIGLVLDQLLGAARKKSDMRIDPFHHLAIELEDEAQYAVRRWMLRAEIDGEVALSRLSHRASQSDL